MDLKDGWTEHIDELDCMFAGVVVNGETSFVPGLSRRLHYVSSGEEEDADQVIPLSCSTPVSCGSKRSSSTRSTISSPSKEVQEHSCSVHGCQDEQVQLQLLEEDRNDAKLLEGEAATGCGY
jgi:hypothetical protein